MFRRGGVLLPAVPLVVAGALLLPAPASGVIGGSVSRYGPWAVRILVDGNPECTGTAITPRWILSASHCFFETAKPITDARISFRVGNLDERKGATVRPVRGSRVGSTTTDMMLIKVAPMKVQVARLSRAKVHPGQLVRQYGWGATCSGEENSCQSPVLKQTDLRVLRPNDRRCTGFAVPDGPDFCMKKVTGIPAGGDSGGPVMTVGPRGSQTLVGVLSGSDRASIAGAGEVAQQLAWIRSVTTRHGGR